MSRIAIIIKINVTVNRSTVFYSVFRINSVDLHGIARFDSSHNFNYIRHISLSQ
jgi:hypothetical protein